MKTIVILLTLLFLSTFVSARTEPDKPDKFVTHCAVMYFLEQLEMVDPLIYETIEKGILESEAVYDGQTGSLCYKVTVNSTGKETDISVILLEKETEYARCNFVFRNGKLQSAMVDVFFGDVGKEEYYFHFYLKGAKHLSYCRSGDGDYRDFSAELFAEHLSKVTPL